jgi:hypothetical protein
MLNAFEDDVFDCENTTDVDCNGANGGTPTGLAWDGPISDGTDGNPVGNLTPGYTDVFVLDLGPDLYGYANTDPQPDNAQNSYYGYLVMNNNFEPFPGTADEAMKATAAHEYNHVLQFGEDAIQDVWMFEATATWAEEKVYPDVNDYLNYIDNWATMTEEPITAFPPPDGSIKVYGSAVWNHWLGHVYGDDVVRQAWRLSVAPGGSYTASFAPDSYSRAMDDETGGTDFSDQFDDFSAAVAEWRAGTDFPDTAAYTDVERDTTTGSLSLGGAPTVRTLDHTTFRFMNVTVPTTATPLTLTATLPAGLNGAIALVGRTGAIDTSGTVTQSITKTKDGGTLTATLTDPNSFGRITAVLVNADVSHGSWSSATQDWLWTKDVQLFHTIRVVNGPAPVTGNATGISTTGATLNGTVNPAGVPTKYQFHYGADTNYGSTVPAGSGGDAGSGNAGVGVSHAISGLQPGTIYHYKLVASNSNGTVHGSDQTFTTTAPPASPSPPTPPTTNPGPVIVTPFALSASITKGRLLTVLKKGLKARVKCGVPCKVSLKLVISKKLAKKLKLKKTTVATGAATLAKASGGTVTLRFTKAAKKALAKLKKLPATVKISGRGSATQSGSLSRAISLKR